jgi:hypothetical protein
MISSRNAAARAQHDQGNQGTPDRNYGPEPAPVLPEITGHAIDEQSLLGKLRAETTRARDQASYSDRDQ